MQGNYSQLVLLVRNLIMFDAYKNLLYQNLCQHNQPGANIINFMQLYTCMDTILYTTVLL